MMSISKKNSFLTLPQVIFTRAYLYLYLCIPLSLPVHTFIFTCALLLMYADEKETKAPSSSKSSVQLKALTSQLQQQVAVAVEGRRASVHSIHSIASSLQSVFFPCQPHNTGRLLASPLNLRLLNNTLYGVTMGVTVWG